jgi:hypothetical protein
VDVRFPMSLKRAPLPQDTLSASEFENILFRNEAVPLLRSSSQHFIMQHGQLQQQQFENMWPYMESTLGSL